MLQWPNPSIERTSSRRVRLPTAAAHVEVSHLRTAMALRPFPLTSFDNDLANLNDWCQVRVVGNVAHDLLSMRSKASLERLD